MRRVARIAVALICSLVVFILGNVGSAIAAGGTPQWTVTAVSRPTNLAPGGEGAYKVFVTNTGSAPSNGEAVTITDELPNGLSLAGEASGQDALAIANESGQPSLHFGCVLGECTYSAIVEPGDTLLLTFPVDVSDSAKAVENNVVRVSGGGAPDASIETPTTISDASASFGISPGGSATAFSSTQAGAHPDFTTSIAFNTVNAEGSLAGEPKEVTDDLPPGFAGDLVDTPACAASTFTLRECPSDTQVGVTTLSLVLLGEKTVEVLPVYNLTPNAGELAKIGFDVGKGGQGDFGIQGNVSLSSNYKLETRFYNINENIAEIDDDSLTIWGVPASPIHNALRLKPEQGTRVSGFFGVPSEIGAAPFFTNPTSCAGEQLAATVTVISWEQQTVSESMPFGPLVGCDRLILPTKLTVEPTTNHAYAPTGLDLELEAQQTYNDPEGLATSTLQDAVVSLPEGMTVNPSQGVGLGACTEAEYAEEGAQYVPGVGCPNESKLGTVRIHSPSVSEEVLGSVYLASPAPNGEEGRNPFKSLIALYIVARIPDRGVLIRAAGEVIANPLTGQLVTTFRNLPPLPFDHFTFSFHSGQTAPLVTPAACGEYSVEALLTPASSPSGPLAAVFAPPFPITQGFDGGACPSGGVPPFNPQVIAGTNDNAAGSYSSMYIRVIRGDGEQEVTRFSAQLPDGLTANLSGVPFCPDADIELAKSETGTQEEEDPSCPAASEIGHTLVGAGVGSVLAYAPGKLYMAGPYHGAPFSIVSITSAKVGPFDLGTVVVREALDINPLTAAVTVDASASDPIPHIIKGIVVHVRDIRVYVDRSNFTLNPTSCERMNFAVTVSGSGANYAIPADQVPVTLNDPFQAADCQSLSFKPGFKVSATGKTSRADGAGLTVDLTYPKAPQGSQANIRSVKVDLPKQLPSRLTTLQKACTAAQFEANPANCPAASRVGQATAVTPILPVPLSGPAYFVSYAGLKFPELIIVLQGYGVTIQLHGETFISKQGITSSTFRTVPDQPVSSFMLTLPQGRYSALAANGNLCKAKLAMPTAFTAQNGMMIHRSTAITVTGCPKKKNTKKKTKSAHKKTDRHKKGSR